MSSNSFTVKPVNDLKSNGFFDSLSYENKERTRIGAETNHIAVYSNYARDLLCCLNSCFPCKLIAPNTHECLYEPVTLIISLFTHLNTLYQRIIKEE
jgi:hypothetical protein